MGRRFALEPMKLHSLNVQHPNRMLLIEISNQVVMSPVTVTQKKTWIFWIAAVVTVAGLSSKASIIAHTVGDRPAVDLPWSWLAGP